MDYAKETTQSLLNSEALQSFKPDPNLVWQSYVLYAVLSAGSVIPWYTFIAGVDYFQYRYPDTSIIRALVTLYLLGWLVSYVLFSWFGRQYTSWARISTGLSISSVVLLVIPILDAGFISGTHGSTATYWVTVAIAFIAGASDATAQGSLLGVGSELPDRNLQAIVIGAGAGGVLIFIVRVIVKLVISALSVDDAVRYSAIFYFVISALLIILFEGAFIYVHRMPEMSYYKTLGLDNFDTMRMVLQDEASITTEVSSGIAIATIAAGRSASVRSLYYIPVMEKNYLLAISLALLYVVTLFIFPGFLSSDMYSEDLHEGWYPLLFVGTFFVMDFLGRVLTAFVLPAQHSVYLSGVIVRLLVLIPFYVLSVVGPSFFSTDIILFVLTALLAVSNGFYVAALIIKIPKSVATVHMESAGVATSSIIVLASLIGIGLSWFWILIRS